MERGQQTDLIRQARSNSFQLFKYCKETTRFISKKGFAHGIIKIYQKHVC
nr:MAG TPA: hypothetical protein [Caudoviricetes sp.]